MTMRATKLFLANHRPRKSSGLLRNSRKASTGKASKVKWDSAVKMFGEFLLGAAMEVIDIQHRGGPKNRLEASKVLLISDLKRVLAEEKKAA